MMSDIDNMRDEFISFLKSIAPRGENPMLFNMINSVSTENMSQLLHTLCGGDPTRIVATLSAYSGMLAISPAFLGAIARHEAALIERVERIQRRIGVYKPLIAEYAAGIY